MNHTHESQRQPAQWERQPGETSRQFATLRVYRDMHPLDRSLAEVGRKLGKSTTYVERLSAKFHWVNRVAAFDREQDRIGQAKRVRAIEAMNERHATIAATILQKVANCLETMDPTSLRPTEVARLVEVASRAERMGRGILPDEPVVQQRSLSFNADEIRRQLKAEGLLPDSEVRSTPVSVALPVDRPEEGTVAMARDGNRHT